MRAVDGALRNLGDAVRMRQDEFNPPLSRRPNDPPLEVQRRVVFQEPARLLVQQERVFHVIEPHLLAKPEGLYRRVVALAGASPRPEQECERNDFGMKIQVWVGCHAPTLPRVPCGTMPTVARFSITPVKSLGLLHPIEVQLAREGIPGNRLFYLVDASGRLFTDAQHGPLVRVAATYDAATGRLALRFPDGSTVDGEASAVGESIETGFWGRVVPGHLLDGPWSAALSAFAGTSLRLARCDRPGDGNDVHSLTLVSVESVDELARRGGARSDLDPARFRMNVELRGCAPHEEDSWAGRPLRVGAAVVRVLAPVPRCVVTTQDPVTGLKDFETLKLIARYRTPMRANGRGLPFGMYAEVEVPGVARVGDDVVPC